MTICFKNLLGTEFGCVWPKHLGDPIILFSVLEGLIKCIHDPCEAYEVYLEPHVGILKWIYRLKRWNVITAPEGLQFVQL